MACLTHTHASPGLPAFTLSSVVTRRTAYTRPYSTIHLPFACAAAAAAAAAERTRAAASHTHAAPRAVFIGTASTRGVLGRRRCARRTCASVAMSAPGRMETARPLSGPSNARTPAAVYSFRPSTLAPAVNVFNATSMFVSMSARAGSCVACQHDGHTLTTEAHTPGRQQRSVLL